MSNIRAARQDFDAAAQDLLESAAKICEEMGKSYFDGRFDELEDIIKRAQKFWGQYGG